MIIDTDEISVEELKAILKEKEKPFSRKIEISDGDFHYNDNWFLTMYAEGYNEYYQADGKAPKKAVEKHAIMFVPRRDYSVVDESGREIHGYLYLVEKNR